jgi:thiamine-monophosphate kinase
MKPVNDEKRLIELIAGAFPSSNLRLNKTFESDAEVVSFSGQQMLFSIDEFSSEDMFRDDDPYSLGWNVAAGAISDISACAGVPLFYGHAMVISKAWDEAYIKKFSQGVADVLKEAGTVFMGGDFGKAEDWRYTAAVIGQPRRKSLSRKGAGVGDALYISGKIGAGNLEAALKFYTDDSRVKVASALIKNRFALRIKESALIGDYASCCIDTSDGVFNSLNIISEINGVGYEISELPYIDIGSLGAWAVSLPRELLFLGEAGEYELLFSVKADREQEMIKKAKEQGLVFYKIGKVVDSARTLFNGKRSIDLSRLDIRARDFDDRKKYLEHLIRYLKEQG